ncbi:YciI family protein [Porifericola rhodea]|uniref:YciI family protein n=1 Tax=Porifericola rhodea TaxID=930972 RepID=UPI0026652A4B|nr:YciI family protein [Porifericola rhodea]WKN32895.1 YciI family protein [Porifericola rhodea]
MEFLVVAYDAEDEEALARRLKVRESHLKHAELMKKKGHLIEGGAILNDEGEMIGSTLMCRFESRQELDQWFANDPYWLGNVWIKLEVKSIRLVKF